MRRALLALIVLLLAATGMPAGADEGRWVPSLPPDRINFTTLSLFDDGTGFAVRPEADAPGTVVLRTDDGGVTWSLVGRSPELNPGARARFVSPEVAFAVNGPLLRSSDGGVTWDRVDGPRPADEAVQGVWYGDLAVAGDVAATGGPVDRTPPDCGDTPPDDNTAVLGVSLDGATSWTIAELPFWAAVRRVDVGADGTGAALTAVIDQTSFRHPLLPNTCSTASRTPYSDQVWTFAIDALTGDLDLREVLACEPVVCTAVARPSADRIVVGMADGTLRVSDDAGETFETVELASSVPLPTDGVAFLPAAWIGAIAFADADTAFAATHGSGIYRSDDGGRTWTEEVSPQRQTAGHGIADLAVTPSGEALANGPLGVLRRTAD